MTDKREIPKLLTHDERDWWKQAMEHAIMRMSAGLPGFVLQLCERLDSARRDLARLRITHQAMHNTAFTLIDKHGVVGDDHWDALIEATDHPKGRR